MVIIAGERSGVGKTTVTLALLSFLSQKGYKVQSFKVGPDYIDPMFHTAVTGYPCRNLDPFLTSEAYIQSCFARHAQGADYTLVEGVMGLFDGIAIGNKGDGFNPSAFASTAQIARLLNLPLLLVIDCSRLSGSVAAIAHGYRSLDPELNLAGVILNRVGSDRHQEMLQEALESIKLPIVGVLRRQDGITIPDRHLGLVTTDELEDLKTIFDQLAHLGETCFNWEKLFPLLQDLPIPNPPPPPTPQSGARGDKRSPQIAIAQDRAFNFYYPDNLDILKQLGAELIPWSPMADKSLPEGVQGLYLGGGFPEIWAQQLAENHRALQAVRSAIASGMPTYSECGGLMYLCKEIIDFGGKSWSMVGALPTTAIMSNKLTLGYRQATGLKDSLVIKRGEILRGHEFHRSKLTSHPEQPLLSSKGVHPSSVEAPEGWQIKQAYASYVHLHFGGYQKIAQRFLQHCLDFFPRVSYPRD